MMEILSVKMPDMLVMFWPCWHLTGIVPTVAFRLCLFAKSNKFVFPNSTLIMNTNLKTMKILKPITLQI